MAAAFILLPLLCAGCWCYLRAELQNLVRFLLILYARGDFKLYAPSFYMIQLGNVWFEITLMGCVLFQCFLRTDFEHFVL